PDAGHGAQREASVDGSPHDGGSVVGPADSMSPTDVDGSTTVLTGDPSSSAILALTDAPATPAPDADIENGVIMTRLDVWLEQDATVDQVNGALARVRAQIVSVTKDAGFLVLGFARAPDLEALEKKRQELEASPGILFADLATLMTVEGLPPEPAAA